MLPRFSTEKIRRKEFLIFFSDRAPFSGRGGAQTGHKGSASGLESPAAFRQRGPGGEDVVHQQDPLAQKHLSRDGEDIGVPDIVPPLGRGEAVHGLGGPVLFQGGDTGERQPLGYRPGQELGLIVPPPALGPRVGGTKVTRS